MVKWKNLPQLDRVRGNDGAHNAIALAIEFDRHWHFRLPRRTML